MWLPARSLRSPSEAKDEIFTVASTDLGLEFASQGSFAGPVGPVRAILGISSGQLSSRPCRSLFGHVGPSWRPLCVLWGRPEGPWGPGKSLGALKRVRRLHGLKSGAGGDV
eukprot:7217984-Pyramimonas_sp.AAC.1